MRIFFLLLLLLTSCHQQKKELELEGIAMTMPYKIIIADPLNKKDLKQVLKVIDHTFKQVDAIYNNWNQKSEISLFNAHSDKSAFILSDELNEFMEKVLDVVHLTEGRFDPALGPVAKIFAKSMKNNLLPNIDTLKSYAGFSGWEYVQFKSGKLQKKHPRASLDLCATSKGYAIDLLIERFNQIGVKNIFVEWAGEIKATGKHLNGTPWTALIFTKDDKAIIPLDNCSIATSGAAIQNIDNYCHIVDPITKLPKKIEKNSIIRASVKANNCYIADALATAALTFSDTESAKIWAKKITDKHPDITFWIVEL